MIKAVLRDGAPLRTLILTVHSSEPFFFTAIFL